MSLVERGTRGHPRIRIRLIHLLVFAFGGAAALRWAPGVACGGGGVACGQRVVVGGWRRERGGEVARIRRRSISDGAHTLCCSSSRACLIRARRCRRLPGYRAGVCAADSAVGLCSSISLMAWDRWWSWWSWWRRRRRRQRRWRRCGIRFAGSARGRQSQRARAAVRRWRPAPPWS